MLFMSDECWFQLNGYVNSQNCRIWGREPPNEHVQVALNPQKVGIWAALSRQRVIGPIFFDGRLNAERYQNEILIPFIDQLDEYEVNNGWFQQDGAPAHTANRTINFLERHFPGR